MRSNGLMTFFYNEIQNILSWKFEFEKNYCGPLFRIYGKIKLKNFNLL